jgi:hypothetical protein
VKRKIGQLNTPVKGAPFPVWLYIGLAPQVASILSIFVQVVKRKNAKVGGVHKRRKRLKLCYREKL